MKPFRKHPEGRFLKPLDPSAGRSPLRREIALVLFLKLVALAALWVFFFSPPHRLKPTPAGMAAHLSGAAPINEGHF